MYQKRLFAESTAEHNIWSLVSPSTLALPVLIIEESSKAKFRRDELQPNPKIIILNGRASSICIRLIFTCFMESWRWLCVNLHIFRLEL